MAYMTRVKTQVGVKPAPLVAFFSSRGPNVIEPAILKVTLINFLLLPPLDSMLGLFLTQCHYVLFCFSRI